jgi:serine/threonine protein kinase
MQDDHQQQLAAVLNDPSHDVRVIASSPHRSDSATFPDNFEPWLTQELKRNTLRLPPLIERADDLPDLVNHFVGAHCRRIGQPTPTVGPETMSQLVAYSWPGNLRELEDVIRRSVEATQSSELRVESRLLQRGIPLGNYRLTRKLGSGAMGEVWEASHQLLARSAAVKLISLEGADAALSASTRRRFEREAQVTANLRSRNTVELYDFGVSEEGTFYYVMELLDGIDLHDAVREFGTMPPERVADLLTQVCCSLAEAHEAGLVHRDIKPANLFITQLGVELDVLKVLDFGIVSEPTEADATQLTSDNAIAGTPAYISPEAAMASARLTDKADIYSLGCVAYWLVTGQTVFEAPTTMALAMKHVMETPPVPSQVSHQPVPEALEEIIMRCLAKEPAERPSAIDLWWELLDTGLPQQWDVSQASDWWETNLLGGPT